MTTLVTKGSTNYELLDSGEGKKLERFGSILLSRPDPQALWQRNLGETEWQKANATFEKGWSGKKEVPSSWKISFGTLTFVLKLSVFKHIGLFPEQVENWKWIQETIKNSGRKISVLNLFGYTGGATLAALSAGADVCHVDGSKVALSAARDNAEASGLAQKPVRWILDDATAFLRREVKRGNKYDAIIMDPPAFGRGPEGEVWKIENDLLPLLELSKKVLSDEPTFFLINGYASGYSPLSYANVLEGVIGKGEKIEHGELAIEETKTSRLLPAGIFARFRR